MMQTTRNPGKTKTTELQGKQNNFQFQLSPLHSLQKQTQDSLEEYNQPKILWDVIYSVQDTIQNDST